MIPPQAAKSDGLGSCLAQAAVARVQTKHVLALHAGGVAQLHAHWLRSCRLLREPRHVHLPRAGTTRNYAHVLCVVADKVGINIRYVIVPMR